MNIKVADSGRSMMEMLGVLAVIGVLSVAGIAGYSQAIDRYKINETINQVTYIVHNTRDLFKTQPDLYGSMSFTVTSMSDTSYANRQLADKAQIFPASAVKNGYKNMFGGNIYFYADGRFAADDGKAFMLVFHGIPQEACIELATRDWQSSLGLIAMRVRGTIDSYSIQGSYTGSCTTKYTQGAALICANNMPMTLEQATSACDAEKNNYIYWKFY